jgi:hypothetical protein
MQRYETPPPAIIGGRPGEGSDARVGADRTASDSSAAGV